MPGWSASVRSDSAFHRVRSTALTRRAFKSNVESCDGLTASPSPPLGRTFYLSFPLNQRGRAVHLQPTRPLLSRAAHLSRNDDRRAGGGSFPRVGWVTRVLR